MISILSISALLLLLLWEPTENYTIITNSDGTYSVWWRKDEWFADTVVSYEDFRTYDEAFAYKERFKREMFEGHGIK